MSDWISTEEKMPKEYLPVLIAHQPFDEVVTWIAMQVEGRWVQCHDPEREFCTKFISHWMPFPEPPKAESAGGK